MTSPFHASILHRYDFAGTTTLIADSIGSATATAMGCTPAGGSIDLLATSSTAYIQLPADILDGLSEITVEAWLRWHTSGRYQRIFDFGSTSGGKGVSFLLLSPCNQHDVFAATVNFTSAVDDSAGNYEAEGGSALSTSMVEHVAMTYDGSELAIYRNGTFVESTQGISLPLSSIDDANNWIGRSQFSADGRLDATIYEFRIYGAALTASEIEESYAAGQDP